MHPTDGGSPRPEDASYATMYPDLLAAGGLATAIARAARGVGIDLGTVSVNSEEARLTMAEIARIAAGTGAVGVSVVLDRRLFSTTVSRPGNIQGDGGTENLLEVVSVAHAWRGGATLRELNTRFPFMRYSRMALAFEDGDHVPVRWHALLHDENLDLARPLLQAAYANARLRNLFPSVSHLTLVRFAVDALDRSAGEVRIRLGSDGAHRVDATWADERAVPTVEEAVEVAGFLVSQGH